MAFFLDGDSFIAVSSAAECCFHMKFFLRLIIAVVYAFLIVCASVLAVKILDEGGLQDVTSASMPCRKGIWKGWLEQRFQFGFPGVSEGKFVNPEVIPTFTVSEGTVICAGNRQRMRWGAHVFEGYAADALSRLTMLLNKHSCEEGKPVAEAYYYLPTYNHHENAYGFFRLGSDVAHHSYLFSRDKAVAFGEVDFRNVIQLASIDPDTDLDSSYATIEEADAAWEPEGMSKQNAKCVRYLALKNARDGAMFYDAKRKKVVVKVGGEWCDVPVVPSPAGLYPF